MTHDPRCCGTGTCLINTDGECWCGQRWDGEKMCHPPLKPLAPLAAPDTAAAAPPQAGPRGPAPEAG